MAARENGIDEGGDTSASYEAARFEVEKIRTIVVHVHHLAFTVRHTIYISDQTVGGCRTESDRR
jgi:hypothetical protein